MAIGGLNAWVGGAQGDHGWSSGTLQVNPTDGTVLASISGLTGGKYMFATSGFGTAGWTYDIQLQDVNNTVVQTQRRNPGTGTDDFLFPNKVSCLADYQLKLILRGGITGTVQMSIFFQEVG